VWVGLRRCDNFVAPVETGRPRGQYGGMAANETERGWRRVDQEWRRMLWDFRRAAQRVMESGTLLSERDADFYVIVLRLTDPNGDWP